MNSTRQCAHATWIIWSFKSFNRPGRSQMRHASTHAGSAQGLWCLTIVMIIMMMLLMLLLFGERCKLTDTRFPWLCKLIQPGHWISPTWWSCEGLGAWTTPWCWCSITWRWYRWHQIRTTTIHTKIYWAWCSWCCITLVTCKVLCLRKLRLILPTI